MDPAASTNDARDRLFTKKLTKVQRNRGLLVLGVTSPLAVYGLANSALLQQLRGNSTALFAIDAFGSLLLPAALFTFLFTVCGVAPREFGLPRLRFHITSKLLLEGLVCTVAFLAVAWVAPTVYWRFLWSIDWIHQSGGFFSYREMIPEGPFAPVVVIYFALNAAIFEELYFRGALKYVVYSFVGREIAPVIFVIVSALVFGAVHWEGGLAKTLGMTTVGALAGLLYLWTKDLLPLMFAHFLTVIVYINI